MTERYNKMNAISKLAIIDNTVMPGGTPSSEVRQFLAFRLGSQEYGLEVKYVQTLLHYRSLNRIADGAELVQGVAVVDGVIMPLVDMRIPIQCGPALSGPRAAAIILNLPSHSVAMVVDDVSDLVALGTGQIDAPPHATVGLDRHYLIGAATLGERSLILLDVEQLMCVAPAALLGKRAA